MTAKSPTPLTRTEYLIDRHQVVFEAGGGWHCDCDEFKTLRECRHTRESEGRRAAQVMIAQRIRSVNGNLAGFSHHLPEDGPTPGRIQSQRLGR